MAAWIAAAFFLFGFVILPSILKSSPITTALVAVEQFGLGLLGLLFAGIALVKYLLQLSSREGQTSPIRPQKAAYTRSPVRDTNPSGLDRAWSDVFSRVQSRQEEPSLAKPTVWSLELLRAIEWKRFEDLCAAFYREKGIRCETTPLGEDGGVDIRLFQDENSDKATAIVQCKAWGKNRLA